MDWDQGQVFSSDQHLRVDKSDKEELLTTPRHARTRFKEFIRCHRQGNLFNYRDQLLLNFRKRQYSLDVDLEHLNNFDSALKDVLQEAPSAFLPIFEEAAREVLNTLAVQQHSSDDASDDASKIPAIQITLTSRRHSLTPIRRINAGHVNNLIKVPGIVISQQKVKPKAVVIAIRCKTCKSLEYLRCPVAFGGVRIPSKCRRSMQIIEAADGPAQDECGKDPYVIQPDLCTYVDTQILKLQECPEDVPTGEMPRHTLLSMERSLAGLVPPGTRVAAMAISCIFESKRTRALGTGASIRTPYLRVVGLDVDGDGAGRLRRTFKPEEEAKFLQMSKQPDIYEQICRSISPSISGSYTHDIKKAVACLLFGGSRKVLPDGMKLRGDINVLMLGDPSTAKSQFLKFTEKAAPVGVYTSGKGSSAAGLTASVIKDRKGEFYLEGGAMVLADGGVVCIDEFDKMREQDRVAIHEAMEQQTISVAKAGITTILNSRVSVLAAANPVYGRYQDDMSAAENINFLPSILSRFDLIFIVRDVRDRERDERLAKHVVVLHMNAESEGGVAEGEIPLETMTNYIAYCRQKCAPRLSLEAARTLSNHYVRIRQEMRMRLQEEKSVIPITVRQLEAITRIAEALAKLALKPEATQEHVTEAIRLFKVSTLSAAQSKTFEELGLGDSADGANMKRVEDELKRRIAVGSQASVARVREEFTKQGFARNVIDKTMDMLVRRGDFQHRDKRQAIVRAR